MLNDATGHALNSVDTFNKVGQELARNRTLGEPRYKQALDHLIEVVQLLLAANENMSRWLHKFTYSDFRTDDARGNFLEVTANYKTAKGGRDFHQMKWPCGEIRYIYDTYIRPDMADLFVQTEVTPEQLDAAFSGLGSADEDMVGFIYETVVGGIDEFLSATEPAVDRGDFDAAEQARLEFKSRARDLSERLERLGGGLNDLLLDFVRLAGRTIRLTTSH